MSEAVDTDAPCRSKAGWLSGEMYCAIHGRAAGWPCSVVTPHGEAP